MHEWSRRKFFLATLVGGVAASAQKLFGAAVPSGNGAKSATDLREPESGAAQGGSAQGTRPLIVCAANGFQHLDKGMDILKKGGDRRRRSRRRRPRPPSPAPPGRPTAGRPRWAGPSAT